MYKLISLDLDGTLLKSDHSISTRNLKAIEYCQNHNIETVVATGRPPRFTMPYLPSVLTNEYCICYNGAKIFYRGQVIDETFIHEDVIIALFNFIEKQGLFRYAVESDDVIYANFDLTDAWHLDSKSIEAIENYKRICKILIMNDSFPVDLLREHFSEACNIMETDGNKLIEIVAKGVSKFHAIEKVVQRMGISIQEVIAFGDDHNDLEIIEGVGLGVAMGNAVDRVKKQADRITCTNEEDGVAMILEEVFHE